MYLVWLSNIMRMNTLNQIKFTRNGYNNNNNNKTFTFNLFMPCGLFCLYILDWSIAMLYGNLGI